MNTRVLVVDDAAVFRRVISGALAGIPGVEVAGSAADALRALSRLEALQPDLITLDLEMPGMHGLELMKAMKTAGCRTAILVLSSHVARGSAMAARAQELGAFHVLAKPDAGSPENSLIELRTKLTPVLRAFERCKELRSDVGSSASRIVTPADACGASASPFEPTPAPSERQGPPLVLIGVSTGGPSALAELLPALPAQLPAPVFVVQHIPPLFTQALARSLQAKCAIRVNEACDQEVALPGHVYIAPGGRHMKLAHGPFGEIMVRLTNDPPENNCRPSVDYLFRSAALRFPGRSVVVILTGMGDDGARGLRMLKRGGCQSIAQDKATSVVFGMPREAILTGAVDQVLPLPKIASAIVRAVSEVAG